MREVKSISYMGHRFVIDPVVDSLGHRIGYTAKQDHNHYIPKTRLWIPDSLMVAADLDGITYLIMHRIKSMFNLEYEYCQESGMSDGLP